MARAWAELGRTAQVARLRRLARDCLPRFGVPYDAELTLLEHLENTTFRVRAPSRNHSLVLRIHRPGKHSDIELRSELAWLAALGSDTGLPVPVPLRTQDGDALARVRHAAVPESRACTLLRWVGGRRLSRPGATYFARLGAFTAELHRHGSEWRAPEDFRRWSWDARGLLGPHANLGDGARLPEVGTAEADLLASARETIRALLNAPRTAERYGLIHSDLHRWNVLDQRDRVGAIDFDDCGFGWYLYDAAVTLMDWHDHPDFDRFLDAYRSGYEDIRSLPGLDARALRTYALARTLAGLGWVATRRDVPMVQAHAPFAVADAIDKVQRYLASA